MLACFDVVFKCPCLFRESADSHAPCLALSQILEHVCYVKGLSPAWLCLFIRGFVKKYLGSCQIKPSKALAIGLETMELTELSELSLKNTLDLVESNLYTMK